MKRFTIAPLVSVLCLLVPLDVLAQAFPIKPVRVIVPFTPGGGADIQARLLSQKLQEIWGQSVLIEHKPGAATIIGTDAVAKAAPNGYTMGAVFGSYTINPSLRSDMPFDTLKDLSGVSMFTVTPLVITATNSLPANNVTELIALAKTNAGKLTYATPGNGTTMHLAGELFKSLTGTSILHIPYKGSAQAYPDVIAGRVSLQIDTLHASSTNIKTGKVKGIAFTSLRREPSSPDIPTVAEILPEFKAEAVSGIVVPSATPRDVVHKISADINKALKSPDLVAHLKQQGMEPAGTTPEQFDAFIRSEIEKWGKVVKFSGAKAAD